MQWLCVVLDELLFLPSTGKHCRKALFSHGVNTVAAVPSFKSIKHTIQERVLLFPSISIKATWLSLNQWLWLGLWAMLISLS